MNNGSDIKQVSSTIKGAERVLCTTVEVGAKEVLYQNQGCPIVNKMDSHNSDLKNKFDIVFVGNVIEI